MAGKKLRVELDREVKAKVQALRKASGMCSQFLIVPLNLSFRCRARFRVLARPSFAKLARALLQGVPPLGTSIGTAVRRRVITLQFYSIQV